MRATLLPHPDTPCAALDLIEVEIDVLGPGRLRLRYSASGRIAELLAPGPAAPARTDELWRHTCFELFIRQPGADPYLEFNFSPSTQWAAYAFDRYRRQGARDLECLAPSIEMQRGAERLEFGVCLDLAEPPAGPLRVALSAVIEETDGAKSFWALAHPAGGADFHHPDCFALEIGALDQAAK